MDQGQDAGAHRAGFEGHREVHTVCLVLGRPGGSPIDHAIDRPLGWKWSDIVVMERATQGRKVKDFETVAKACGAAGAGQGKCKIVMCTIGCDLQGTGLESFLEYAKMVQRMAGVVEGPCLSDWNHAEEWCEKADWAWTMVEFLTTEFGEGLARRRKALMVLPKAFEERLTSEPLNSGRNPFGHRDQAGRGVERAGIGKSFFVFISTHTFSARGPMSPPYCAFGSAGCFYTGQSPDVLNPKSTIRMGVGGCCRGVVAGFPRGVG